MEQAAVLDELDVVRGPRIKSAKELSGNRISVAREDVCANGNPASVVVYNCGVYLLCDQRPGNNNNRRVHYRNIAPDGFGEI